MISVYESKKAKLTDNEDYVIVELRGLSTDEKPSKINEYNVGNGSTYIEIDTGKIYMYNATSSTWSEI